MHVYLQTDHSNNVVKQLHAAIKYVKTTWHLLASAKVAAVHMDMFMSMSCRRDGCSIARQCCALTVPAQHWQFGASHLTNSRRLAAPGSSILACCCSTSGSTCVAQATRLQLNSAVSPTQMYRAESTMAGTFCLHLPPQRHGHFPQSLPSLRLQAGTSNLFDPALS